MLTIVIIMTIIIMGDRIMSKRIYFLLSVIFLTLGALIYALYRPNSQIAVFCDKIVELNSLRQVLVVFENDFIKFYLPDFLWGISLCFSLYAVFLPSLKGAIIISTVAVFCGICWEILQWTDLVGGTGDVLDIMMYFAAGVLTIFISLKKEKEK